MKVPRKISIAGHEISIKHKKGLNVGGQEAWGVWDDAKHIIYLRFGMDKTRKQEILIHEIIHAIDHIHVLHLSERVVKILGVEIVAAIRNNNLKLIEQRKSSVKPKKI